MNILKQTLFQVLAIAVVILLIAIPLGKLLELLSEMFKSI